tara:strand:+ start:13071 stop:15284 length:2214 start_codon:yes stop_codon:yes gene_type:complete
MIKMKNINTQLNDNQQLAVETPSGPLIILAGPGSGKTRVITYRITHLVKSLNIEPHRILAVTFTNKAAREMRERIQQLLGDQATSLSMGTFHSICARILRVDGSLISLPDNFVIYDSSDQLALIRQIESDLSIDSKKFPPRQILSTISKAKNKRFTDSTYQKNVENYYEEIVGRVFKEYTKRLAQSNAVDFDDLLGKTLDLFENNELILRKYANRYIHTLIDEFQDTNIIQYQIARMIASVHQNITVVGDPDQSIYSWRAADIKNIDYLQRDFPSVKTILLEQNYRSTEHILKAADSVINELPNRPNKSTWTNNPQGEKIYSYVATDSDGEGQFIADEIKKLTQKTAYNYSDFAIMYRINAQSRAIEDAFIRKSIPYRIVGGTRFYDRLEIRDIIAYLRIIYNAFDSFAFQRIVNVPKRNIGKKSLEQIMNSSLELGMSPIDVCAGITNQDRRFPTFPSARKRNLQELVAHIEILENYSKQHTIIELLDKLLLTTNYRQHLIETDSEHAEGRWENIEELRSVATLYQDVSPESTLAQFLEEIALVSDVDDPNDETQSVTLTSLHSAKGLEYPVVFMPGLEEGLLPSMRSFDDPKQLEEERRVCYVGMTRAEHILYLTRSENRFLYGTFRSNPPSRFLSDIPEENLQYPFRGTIYSGKNNSGLRGAAQAQQIEKQTKSKIESSSYQPGDQVVHEKFGKGTVIECKVVQDDQQITVAFEGQGIKKLMLSFAPLRLQHDG